MGRIRDNIIETLRNQFENWCETSKVENDLNSLLKWMDETHPSYKYLANDVLVTVGKASKAPKSTDKSGEQMKLFAS